MESSPNGRDQSLSDLIALNGDICDVGGFILAIIGNTTYTLPIREIETDNIFLTYSHSYSL